jgi:hypothetical protein
MEDQLINEIRAIKDRLASKYNYDLRAIYNDIAQKQRLSSRKIVNLSKNKGLIRRSTEHQGASATLQPPAAG